MNRQLHCTHDCDRAMPRVVAVSSMAETTELRRMQTTKCRHARRRTCSNKASISQVGMAMTRVLLVVEMRLLLLTMTKKKGSKKTWAS